MTLVKMKEVTLQDLDWFKVISSMEVFLDLFQNTEIEVIDMEGNINTASSVLEDVLLQLGLDPLKKYDCHGNEMS